MNDTLAVVLGGGAGTRLDPLTRHRSKPAVPLAGKYRLVDIALSNCINSGLSRVFVLTQHNSASLNRHVTKAYRFDHFGGGFASVLAPEQTSASPDWHQGPADAVRHSLHHLDANPHRRVLVVSGDGLYRMDYRAFTAHHRAGWADLTVALSPVTAETAATRTIVRLDPDGILIGCVDRPDAAALDGLASPVSAEHEAAGRVYLAAMGLYVFERDVLREVLLGRPDHAGFLREVLPAAVAERRVLGYVHDGYFSDIGTIRSFYEANLALAEPTPAFDLYGKAGPIYTNPRMIPPAKILDSSVEASLIGEGAVVSRATVERSVIGIRSRIEAGAVLRRTVMMGADVFAWHEAELQGGIGLPERPGIGEGSVVENAIIDKNAQVGPGCHIANVDGVERADGDGWAIRDGIVVIPKNAVIPAGTVI